MTAIAAALERDFPRRQHRRRPCMVQTLHDRTVGNVAARARRAARRGGDGAADRVRQRRQSRARARRGAAERDCGAHGARRRPPRPAVVPADREPRARRRRRRARPGVRGVGHRRPQGAWRQPTCRGSTTCSSMRRRSPSRCSIVLADRRCSSGSGRRCSCRACRCRTRSASAAASAAVTARLDALGAARRRSRRYRSCCCSAPACCCGACRRCSSTDLGFDADGPHGASRLACRRRAIRRRRWRPTTSGSTTALAAMPGVTRVARISGLPLGPSENVLQLHAARSAAAAAGQGPCALYRVVDPDYFADAAASRCSPDACFAPTDRDGAQPVLSSSAGAWRTIVLARRKPGRPADSDSATASGAASSASSPTCDRRRSPQTAQPEMYVPHAQIGARATMTYVVESALDAAQVLPAARDAGAASRYAAAADRSRAR